MGDAQLLAYHDEVPPLQYEVMITRACMIINALARSLTDIYAHLLICFDNPICICPFHPPSLCVACSRATPSLAPLRFVGDPSAPSPSKGHEHSRCVRKPAPSALPLPPLSHRHRRLACASSSLALCLCNKRDERDTNPKIAPIIDKIR